MIRQGASSSPNSKKKAKARIWYVRSKEAALVVQGEKREETKQAGSKASGGGKEEPWGWRMWWQEGPNFYAKLANFFCVSVCVGTWVLVLNPCYGGKEKIARWSFGFNLSSITRDGILKRVLIKLLIGYVLSRVQLSAFCILRLFISWFVT